jgi:hypothetical protein
MASTALSTIAHNQRPRRLLLLLLLLPKVLVMFDDDAICRTSVRSRCPPDNGVSRFDENIRSSTDNEPMINKCR